MNPNADRLEWDPVLEGQRVERQRMCCRYKRSDLLKREGLWVMRLERLQTGEWSIPYSRIYSVTTYIS